MGPVAWQLRARGAWQKQEAASRRESLGRFSPSTTNGAAVVWRIFDAAADQTKRPFLGAQTRITRRIHVFLGLLHYVASQCYLSPTFQGGCVFSQCVSRERLTIPCKGPHLLLLCLAGRLTHADPAAYLGWEAENVFSSELGATASA